MQIDPLSFARLMLLYAHLLLCVFALQNVLSSDWKVMMRRVDAAVLDKTHRVLSLLLGGLWLSGLGIVGLDTGFEMQVIETKPKLMAKLVCVSTLTLNGVMLRLWCFPRMASGHALGRGEATAVMVFGAISTASWLMAAFFGIAKPLQAWTAGQCIALYATALGVAVPVAIALAGRLRHSTPGAQPTGASQMPATGR